MTGPSLEILVSGAGIAGPVLAYWLRRYGHRPTVIEKASSLRTGGHPVDLWGNGVAIAEQMGILPRLKAERTGNETGIIVSPDGRVTKVGLNLFSRRLSDRHLEIMRGRLVTALHETTRQQVPYMFGDSIADIEQDAEGVRVLFEQAPPRRFDLVVGADGQHSRVRRIVFGDEQRFSHYLGGYICGFTIPDVLELDGRIAYYLAPGRTVAAIPIRQTNELAVGFLFRRAEPFDIHHDDTAAQKTALREIFTGDGWEIPRLLAAMDESRDFYFESFSQIRMETWTSGRVALVGDAAYGPAPAIGGGTTLAAVGAYVLAGEVNAAKGDVATALRNYQEAMRDVAIRSRDAGPHFLKALIPKSKTAVWLSTRAAPLLKHLPSALVRRLPLLPPEGVRALKAAADLPLKDYDGNTFGQQAGA